MLSIRFQLPEEEPEMRQRGIELFKQNAKTGTGRLEFVQLVYGANGGFATPGWSRTWKTGRFASQR